MALVYACFGMAASAIHANTAAEGLPYCLQDIPTKNLTNRNITTAIKTFQLQYSVDNGDTWIDAGTSIILPGDSLFHDYQRSLSSGADNKDNLKIRWVATADGVGHQINNIYISGNRIL